MGFQANGSRSTIAEGVNLDAGGILIGKPNNTSTDRVGAAWPIDYKTVKEPIIYLTVPDQMDVIKYPGSNVFYLTFPAEERGSVPKPKISRKHNTNGQTVVVLDWTGTGYELKPTDYIYFAVKVRADAVNGFDTAEIGRASCRERV